MTTQTMPDKPAQTQTQTQPRETTDFDRLLKKEKGEVKYIPFGSDNTLKLTVSIVQNLIAVKTKSGRTCSENDAIKFIAMCEAQRLNPFAGDAYLVGYDQWDKATQTSSPKFSLISAHQSLLKRAEASQAFAGMESGIIILTDPDAGTVLEREGDFRLPNEVVVGGWARVHREGRKPTYRRLAITQRKPNYETPFWSNEKAPEQIVKCAEADALRATFPTLLGGLYTEPEMLVAPREKDNGATELGRTSSRLVKMVEPEPTPAAEPEAQSAEPEPAQTAPAPAASDACAELEKLVTDAGCTFNHFQTWARESGNVTDADSLSGFGDVKEADAKRLLRAKTGLIRGLQQAKEEAK